MTRKFYTIFILPHAHERFRQLHFSKGILIGVGVLLALIVVAGAAAPHLLLRIQAQAKVLSGLREENRRLREEKQHFEASLAELGNVVSTVEDRARRVARAVGIERLPSDGPSGGTSARSNPLPKSLQEMLNEEMDAIRLRSRNVDRSIDQLDAVIAARERVLASTPSGLPVEGFLSEGFGWRPDPFTGQREFHQGMDIVAAQGSEVRAPADGVVTTVSRWSGYGKMLQLAHGYGYSTRYGHLSEILVSPGQRVRRGDVVGRVGSTGRSTGPHLHYEIFRAGARVDPARYIVEPPS